MTDDLTTRFNSVLANDDPDAIEWLLPRDGVLLGLADSGAHVSQLCDACFSTDLLGNWVRDRGVMPLERAVHKLTAEPAAVYGLDDRGVVAAGRAADLVVFDPATVAPGPLRRVRDFPADGERLTADAPVGVHAACLRAHSTRRAYAPLTPGGARGARGRCRPLHPEGRFDSGPPFPYPALDAHPASPGDKVPRRGAPAHAPGAV